MQHESEYVNTYASAALRRPALSASAPTNVPKSIDEPKPAMKSCPICAGE